MCCFVLMQIANRCVIISGYSLYAYNGLRSDNLDKILTSVGEAS